MINVNLLVRPSTVTVRVSRHDYTRRPSREWVLITETMDLPGTLTGRAAVLYSLRAALALIEEDGSQGDEHIGGAVAFSDI